MEQSRSLVIIVTDGHFIRRQSVFLNSKWASFSCKQCGFICCLKITAAGGG